MRDEWLGFFPVIMDDNKTTRLIAMSVSRNGSVTNNILINKGVKLEANWFDGVTTSVQV